MGTEVPGGADTIELQTGHRPSSDMGSLLEVSGNRGEFRLLVVRVDDNRVALDTGRHIAPAQFDGYGAALRRAYRCFGLRAQTSIVSTGVTALSGRAIKVALTSVNPCWVSRSCHISGV